MIFDSIPGHVNRIPRISFKIDYNLLMIKRIHIRIPEEVFVWVGGREVFSVKGLKGLKEFKGFKGLSLRGLGLRV